MSLSNLPRVLFYLSVLVSCVCCVKVVTRAQCLLPSNVPYVSTFRKISSVFTNRSHTFVLFWLLLDFNALSMYCALTLCMSCSNLPMVLFYSFCRSSLVVFAMLKSQLELSAHRLPTLILHPLCACRYISVNAISFVGSR